MGTLLLGIIINPLLVRALGSSLYGDYAFLMSTLGMVMIIVNAGVFDGTRKYISETRKDDHWRTHVAGFYALVALVLSLGLVLIILGLVFSGIVSKYLGQSFEIYFILLSGIVLCRQGVLFLRGCLMGFGDERHSEVIQVIQKAVFGAAALPLVYLGNGVVGVLVGHLVSLGVGGVTLVRYFNQQIPDISELVNLPSDFPKQELLTFNVSSVVLIFLTASLYHVDILLLRFLVGSAQTGYYKASLTVAEFLWLVPTVVQIILLHSTSEMWSENKTESITKLASQATRYTFALVLLMVIGLAALADEFIPLYFGSDFTKSTYPLLLLLPGTLFFAVARPIFAVGQGKGDLRLLIYATGTASIVNLVLNLLLIPQFGMTGAAVATSIGYGSMFALHVGAARRIGFNPLQDLRVIQICVAGLLSSTIIFYLSSILPRLTALIIVPIAGSLVYVLVLAKLGVIDSQHINRIHGYLA